MIKLTAALFTLLFAAESFAALAPEYQNKRDFDVMLAFIQSHERVISTLKSVDFENTVVYFDEDCIATFGRETVLRLPGWAGPAAKLELKSTTCDLE
tara:strand:+ start:4119 stop:4409 length:291 start_codon:yes stop_codon:yes gene_type:complete